MCSKECVGGSMWSTRVLLVYAAAVCTAPPPHTHPPTHVQVPWLVEALEPLQLLLALAWSRADAATRDIYAQVCGGEGEGGVVLDPGCSPPDAASASRPPSPSHSHCPDVIIMRTAATITTTTAATTATATTAAAATATATGAAAGEGAREGGRSAGASSGEGSSGPHSRRRRQRSVVHEPCWPAVSLTCHYHTVLTASQCRSACLGRAALPRSIYA